MPKEEEEVEAKLASLQQKLRRLDAVSTFVQWSKARRQLQVLEKQRDRLRSERRQQRTFLLDHPVSLFLVKHLLSQVGIVVEHAHHVPNVTRVLTRLRWRLQVLLPLAIALWWWDRPILVVDAATFAPWFVVSWLALPNWPAGTVGVVAWIVICRSVARLLRL